MDGIANRLCLEELLSYRLFATNAPEILVGEETSDISQEKIKRFFSYRKLQVFIWASREFYSMPRTSHIYLIFICIKKNCY